MSDSIISIIDLHYKDSTKDEHCESHGEIYFQPVVTFTLFYVQFQIFLVYLL